MRLWRITALVGLMLLMFICTTDGAVAQNQHHATPRGYARQLTLHRWHSWREWKALDKIVRLESGWDPCAHYPSTHDCFYRGVNACGIPQANPCPTAWLGQLFSKRWAQVRWVVRYITRRYGRPTVALYYHQYRGGY